MSSKVFVTGAAMVEFANKLREGSGYDDLISFPQGFANLYYEYLKYQAFKIQPNAFDGFIEGNVSIVNTYSTYLDSYLFAKDDTITEANLPFCTHIGSYCFTGCENLISVNAPNCTLVNDYAFHYCSSLVDVNIPVCSTLGYSAFSNCGLTTIDLPICTYISPGCFESCVNLSSINIPTCKGIGYRAFVGTSFEIIDFPNVSYLGTQVFAECSNLVRVNLPFVQTIPDSCFKNCSNLSDFSFSEVYEIGENAFQGCGFLSLTIPHDCYIRSRAFIFCNSLQTVSVSRCLYLQDSAFFECLNLKNVYIGSVQSFFGSNVFKNCVALESATINTWYVGTAAFEGCSSLSVVSFNGPDAPALYANCFKNCTSLMSVYITGALASGKFITSTAFINTPLTTLSLTGSYGSIYVPSSCYSNLIRGSYFANNLYGRIVSY